MPRRQAFTLIELLVVISIIALLIAILLPALGAARNSAQTMRCLANQRQVLLACLMYAETNRERFPPLHLGGSTSDPLEGPWYVRLGVAGLLPPGSEQNMTDPSQNALLCPSDVDTYGTNATPYYSWASRFASYGLTYMVAAALDNPTNYRISSNVPNADRYRQTAANGGPRLSEIRRASELIAGGEPKAHREVEIESPNVGYSASGSNNDRNWEWARHTPGNAAQPGETTSGSVANAFYLDGHAATVRHNGIDMVGIREVSSNAEIPDKCRMFVY